MKIAQFDLGNELIVIRDEAMGQHTKAPRVSEWIEVEFKARAPEEFVPEKLAELARLEAELRIQFQQKLDQINGARADLLALTNKVQP